MMSSWGVKPAPADWILYTGTDGQFYRIEVDGTHSQQLTTGVGRKQFYTFSPAQDWIYYTVHPENSDAADTADLYRVKVDGSDQQNILTLPSIFSYPVGWLGDWLYLVVDAFSDADGLYRMQADGTNFQPLTDTLSIYSFDAWRDGWLYFSAQTQDNPMQLYRIRENGEQLQSLTRPDQVYIFVALSPDGNWIYFHSDLTLYRMKTDGTQHQSIELDFGIDFIAGFSPDGEWLHFDGRQGYRYTDMYRVKADLSEAQNLTGHLEESFFVSFSPDGESVLFSKPDPELGGYSLYLMDTETLEVTRFTRLFGGEYTGFWSPDGRWFIADSTSYTAEGRAMNEYYLVQGSASRKITQSVGYKEFYSWLADNDTFLYVNYSESEGGLYRVSLHHHTEQLILSGADFSSIVAVVTGQ